MGLHPISHTSSHPTLLVLQPLHFHTFPRSQSLATTCIPNTAATTKLPPQPLPPTLQLYWPAAAASTAPMCCVVATTSSCHKHNCNCCCCCCTTCYHVQQGGCNRQLGGSCWRAWFCALVSCRRALYVLVPRPLMALHACASSLGASSALTVTSGWCRHLCSTAQKLPAGGSHGRRGQECGGHLHRSWSMPPSGSRTLASSPSSCSTSCGLCRGGHPRRRWSTLA